MADHTFFLKSPAVALSEEIDRVIRFLQQSDYFIPDEDFDDSECLVPLVESLETLKALLALRENVPHGLNEAITSLEGWCEPRSCESSGSSRIRKILDDVPELLTPLQKETWLKETRTAQAGLASTRLL